MAILRLSAASDPRLAVYRDLTNHQLRNRLEPEQGILICESEIAMRVALESGVEPLSLLLDERKVEPLADIVSDLPEDVPTFVLPAAEAERLAGYKVTRGVLCAMRRPEQPPVEQLLGNAKRVLVMEGITDTSNVGALFRNAAALGADAVLIAPTCADPLVRRAVRVSMGNVFRIPWARVSSGWPQTLFETLGSHGFTTLALALTRDACDLRDVSIRPNEPVALFFGSEGTGLTDDVIRACERLVIIPMGHGVDSLNVAASSAVAMWHLFR